MQVQLSVTGFPTLLAVMLLCASAIPLRVACAASQCMAMPYSVPSSEKASSATSDGVPWEHFRYRFNCA